MTRLRENRGASSSPTYSQPFWRKGLGLDLSRALADKASLELTFELEYGTLRAALAQHGAPRRPAAGRTDQPARS